jgi:hypothetical protein
MGWCCFQTGGGKTKLYRTLAQAVTLPLRNLPGYKSSASLPWISLTIWESEKTCCKKTLPRAEDLKPLAHTGQGSQAEGPSQPDQQSLLPRPKSPHTASVLRTKSMAPWPQYTRDFRSAPPHALPHIFCVCVYVCVYMCIRD